VIDYRTLRVWEWLAEYTGTRDTALTLGTICSACVSLTGMTGAWVGRGHPLTETEFATDPLAANLAELQVVLGEGPVADAGRDGFAVAVRDLSAAASRRTWPAFAAAAVLAGIRSMFVVPMRAGAARIGLFGLYSRVPTMLRSAQRAEVDAFADVAVALVVAGSAVPLCPEIHQATGMVSAQLGVGMSESLVRLRAYAFAEARPLADIARDVVTRQLRFPPDNSKRTISGP
jgi:hypothetical protein